MADTHISYIPDWLTTTFALFSLFLPYQTLDGMTDCSDSECCSHPVCSEHIMCLSSNDPVDVLLRKQPPSVTASFHQRVKFLIEENSVQSYAQINEYSERWVNLFFNQHKFWVCPWLRYVYKHDMLLPRMKLVRYLPCASPCVCLFPFTSKKKKWDSKNN